MTSWIPLIFWLAVLDGGSETLIKPTSPHGDAAVLLAGAPVQGATRHAVHWEMLVEGERAWRFRAEFSGIQIQFFDSAGAPLDLLQHHTSCYRTLGWQPAWMVFTTPTEAASLEVRAVIQSPDPLPGQYRLRNVRLVALQDPARPRTLAPPTAAPETAAQPMGGLRLLVHTGDGVPVPARIYLERDGVPLTPPYAFAYEQGAPSFHFQDPALNSFPVPPGRYRARAMRGFEYALAEGEVEVEEGATAEIALTLRRIEGLGRAHWYSGDHHTHLFRHGSSRYPMMNLQDVYTIAQAEGMQFLPFMGVDKARVDQQDFRDTHFIGMTTNELTRDLWGHICPIGVWNWPEMEVSGNAWPMNFDYIDAAVAAGGAIAYAHPYSGVSSENSLVSVADLEAGLIAREFPISLALGQPCTYDILTKEDGVADFDLKLRDYMRLLNLGFRAGVSGSTDFHLDQARMPIGGARTYVHSETLDWAGVARAYREGKTFATNGPLVFLEVNGHGPGEAVHVTPQESLKVQVDAQSLWPLEEVQLWHNGEVVATLPPGQSRYTLKAAHSGWLLAIALGPATPEVMPAPEGKRMVAGQYAITSPVYIEATGAPIRPRPQDAEYFVAWVQAVRCALEKQAEQQSAQGEQVPQALLTRALERIDAAQQVFEQLAQP